MGKGWTSYYAVFQDPRRWMEVGKIDFIVPMVYWEREHPTHPFIPLITEWSDRVAYDRQVIPGLSAALQNKFGWSELSEEIAAVRRKKLPGVVFFSAGGLMRSWDNLRVKEFPFWAMTPRMAWKDSVAPLPPKNATLQRLENGFRLQWEANQSPKPLSYIVYRSDNPLISRNDVRSILFMTARNAIQFVDTTASLKKDSRYFYSLTAVDRVGNESDLSPVLDTGSNDTISSSLKY
jgi:hypothetical protein